MSELEKMSRVSTLESNVENDSQIGRFGKKLENEILTSIINKAQIEIRIYKSHH